MGRKIFHMRSGYWSLRCLAAIGWTCGYAAFRDCGFYHFANGADEGRVCSDGAGAHEFDAAFACDRGGFCVQIEEHFHVVGEKADGNHDEAFGIRVADVIADVGFEPRLARRPGAALEDECRFHAALFRSAGSLRRR